MTVNIWKISVLYYYQNQVFYDFLSNILQTAKHKISTITIVGPTGVLHIIAAKSPVIALKTEITHANMVTFLKPLQPSIDETAGKIIKTKKKRVPTRFIASTIITAITLARIMFTSFVFVPHAKEKFSSKVIANILL